MSNNNANITELLNISEKNTQLNIEKIKLEAQILALKTDKTLLISEKSRLENKLEEEQPVKVITRHLNNDGYRRTQSTDIEYMNLDSVKVEIREKYEKDNQYILNQIKELKAGIEDLKLDILIKDDEMIAHTDREIKRFKIKADNLDASFTERDDEKSKEVKDIKKVLKAERDNKSEKELEKARVKDIKTLKKRISTLQADNDTLAKINPFGRFWRAITNRIALKAAQKEIELEKRAANAININTNSRCIASAYGLASALKYNVCNC